VPGKSYVVEFSTDLETWTEIEGLGSINAAASPSTTTNQDVDVPGAGETAKSYRVRVD
jgi:hypothetical protein